MLQRKFVAPAAVASFGVLIILIINLPSPGSFIFNGPVDHFFRSRTGWGEAFFLAVGVFVILLGICGLIESLVRGGSERRAP